MLMKKIINKNINTSLFALFIALCCLPTQSQAQCSIHGNVMDSDNEALEFATVRLLNKDSTFVAGSATDSIGNFHFTSINIGNYLIAFSSIGYDSQFMSVHICKETTQLQPVKLLTNATNLKEIIVEGKSFIQQKDRLLIFPDKQQVKHAGTGYDILYNLMIPGINVERLTGKVTTFGGEVSLYIDGRKADYKEVRNLRPKDIEKVEYFATPTGIYIGDIASINYVTKKNKHGGYMSLDASQTVGYFKGDYNIAAKYTKRKMNYTLFAGYLSEKNKGNHIFQNETFHSKNYDVYRTTETLDGSVKSNNQYIQLQVLSNDEKKTLSGKISLIRQSEPNNLRINLLNYSGYYDFEQQSQAQSSQEDLQPYVNLYGRFTVGKGQTLETSINSSYTNNKYNRKYGETDFLSNTYAKEDFYQIDGGIKYNISLKNQSSLGFSLHHYHKVSSSNYSGDYNNWQHLWSAESLLIAEYSKQFNQKLFFRVQPGISSLAYHLHGEDLIKHLSPRLETGINYIPAPRHFLQVNGRIANSYPEISTINRVDQVIDFLQVKRGNANMDKANLYYANTIYAFQFSHFNFQAVLEYEFINNIAVNKYYWEADKLINSYQDGVNSQRLAAFLSLTWKANKNLHIKTDISAWRNIYSRAISVTNSSFLGAIQINYYWKNTSFTLWGNTPYQALNTPLSLCHVRSHGNYGATIGWSNKGWRIEIGTTSPFIKQNKLHCNYDTGIYKFSYIQRNQTYQNTAYLKVIYTLDFGHKNEGIQNRTIDKKINSAIMRVE